MIFGVSKPKAFSEPANIEDDETEEIDRTIEAAGEWIRRKIRNDYTQCNVPEMTKALAVLIEARNGQRKKRRFFRRLKKMICGEPEFWYGAFFVSFVIWFPLTVTMI